MASPLVSVVIPTYNQPPFLTRTLESVFAQTFNDYEVVVVNDGSTDDTLERLGRLKEQHADRLRIIDQENGGIGAARNRGMKEARGRYIALLDHDDVWKPGKLEAQVEFLRSHPECVAVTVPWAYSTAPDRCVFDLARVADRSGIIGRPLKALAETQLILVSSSLMFDRVRAEALWFETRRQCIEDYPFQINLFGRGSIGVAGDTIQMVYTVHPGNTSSHAINHYHGIRMMREMDAAGQLRTADAVQRGDLQAFLSHVGRTATVMQLCGGHRLRGLKTYVRELPHQARLGRLKFLALYPLLLCAPMPIVQWKWGRGIK